ncbi:MAG: hypothetical protein CML04_01400 [Pseudozobellia sp.]|nr:hypothetical protein [Pseudozobellia sp.]MBG48840.1 hypothetical protein [Pseudozobellia sp.]
MVQILSESFDGNKSVLSVVNGKKRLIPKLMDYSFEKGLATGEVWIKDNRTASIVVLFPNKPRRISLSAFTQDLKLVFNVIGVSQTLKILKRKKLIEKHQPRSRFIHLWYIGVLCEHKNKGIERNLLQSFMKIKAKDRLPIFLETSSNRNIGFYRDNGFQVVVEIVEKLPYRLYVMAKYPD